MWYEYLILGFVLSLGLTFLALKVFPKLGLLDFPQRYGLDRERIPYPGGLVILLLGCGMWLVGGKEFLKIIPAVLLIGLVSFVDDRRSISASLRLLVYFICGVWVFWSGVSIDFIGIPWRETNFELVNYFWLSLGATVLWIVVLQQAMNWFDGLKGLCTGVSGVGFLTLGVLGLVKPELFFDMSHAGLTVVNFYLAGVCLGGWWLYWKGKIILGDTGAQVLGFLLGVMAIWSGAKIMTLLIVLALPVIDFGLVVFRRVILEKRSMAIGDGGHLHHHLMRVLGGISNENKGKDGIVIYHSEKGEKRATVVLVGVTVLLGVIAVFLSGMVKMMALGVVVVCVVFVGGRFMMKR